MNSDFPDDEPTNDLEEAIINMLDVGEEIGESSDKNAYTSPPPDEVYVLPLIRRPFFPGMAAPIFVEPGPYYEVLKIIAKSKEKYVGLVLTEKEDTDIYKLSFKELSKVGVLARILRIVPAEQEGAQVILNIEKRMTIEKPIDKSPHLKAKISCHEDTGNTSEELRAYSISIITTIKELLELNPLFKEELHIFLGQSDFTDPGKLADFAVALTTASREELQDVLQTFDLQKRIDKALILLKKELDISRIQNNINLQIESSLAKNQKEFLLREQLRTIKRELGIERDDKTCDIEKFEARIRKRKVPNHVMEIIDEEMEKLNTLDVQSAEYSVCRGYLDWLTVLPWGIYSEDTHNLRKATSILKKDHYGLEDIKKRILEFISVGKLSGGVRGSIICLVGPPGVGKTSVGKSIARALGRKFYRFSVGGMRDEAEIKGHRRTYIGAMPGKLLQALKHTQTMNPVIMIDEIDKMGSSYRGDPASAMLEVLDPEQNSEFMDHYLDVSANLSDVLFIVTANVLDTIPEPLQDRMDIMRLSGYILEEKVQIAKKYLIPRNRKEMGLLAKNVDFTKDALTKIVNGYAREAGVRSLEKNLKKIMRKVAVKVVKDQEKRKRKKKSGVEEKEKKYSITGKNLQEFLGQPIHTSDRFYHKNPVGVCTGLAWTAQGGATLYIEAIKVHGEKTEMKLTGQAGEVMKESSQIAWSYLHSALHKYAPEFTFFEKSQIHIHIPEGATPKDGPSAGITMVTALLSLLLDTPVYENLGMTGELTLTGRILPIGGVKEKLIASKRSGLNVLIFPKENERDFEDLPENILEGLEFHFVEHYDEVFHIAFPFDEEE